MADVKNDEQKQKDQKNSDRTEATSNTQSTTEKVKASAEKGQDRLRARVAQGEPGTKQPEHKDSTMDSKEAAEEIDNLRNEFSGAKPRESSAKRAESGDGAGNHPIPPEERQPGVADQQRASLNAAAGHMGAARTALTRQYESDARLTSDPRYERDQKVYEMGQRGELAYVPPSEAEKVAQVNVSEEVQDAIPDGPQEQADEDMKRLEEGEKTAQVIKSSGGTENPNLPGKGESKEVKTDEKK